MEKVALIIAGGIGSRLWPISTDTKSKQFINLYNDKTLIQNTIKRINKVFKLKDIYIVGSIKQKEELYKNLKNVDRNNILLEPKMNMTACAIYYGLSTIYKKYKDCIVGIFPSDHYIENTDEFANILNRVSKLKSDRITILGIKPTKPDPKFGYLVFDKDNELTSFVEKPSIHIAKRLMRKNALWSIGVYIGNINTFNLLFKKYLKNIYDSFAENKSIKQVYDSLNGVSFEREIIEKHPEYFRAETGNFNWMDVGSFDGLDKIIQKGKNNNNINKNNKYLKSSNCTLISTNNKKIYAIGVNDLMLIENDDTILVVKKNMYNHIEKLREEK